MEVIQGRMVDYAKEFSIDLEGESEEDPVILSTERRKQIDILCASLDSDLTEEQKLFASDFTSPLISFSNPGTGKTHSMVAGLIMAQTYHGIAGRKINAMSFTNMATAELKAKYDNACKKCCITPTVNFNTFHSLCYDILRKKYRGMSIKRGIDFSKDLPVLKKYLEKYSFTTDDMFYVRHVLDAVNSLNSALAYDEENIRNSSKFKLLDMDMDVFQNVRADWFTLGLMTNSITQGDIPIYALYTLLKDKKLQQEYKQKYRIMVVDEFQDLTLLHLKILSTVSSNLVAIGDMKQQIYAFNGSSQQIVEEYLKIYPNARQVSLTKSFRCKNEIADFSTKLVVANNRKIKAFEGASDGASIQIRNVKELDLKGIVMDIKKDQDINGIYKARDVMFLFRNNLTATPIAEELYKQNVLFRINKFVPIMSMPIFKEMCNLIDAAKEPENLKYVSNIISYFPEFRKYSTSNCPILIAMEKSQKNLFDCPYQYKNESSEKIITALKRVALFVQQNKPAGLLFRALLPVYEEFIIEGKWWKLELEKEVYFELAEPIIATKDYGTMKAQELEKVRRIKEASSVNLGVKCYTIHSAKGLEADDVYILDADDNVFPSKHAMERYINMGCEFEAAKELRNERNLLYVAATRAKDNLYITYREKLTKLIEFPMEHNYSYLDAIYDTAKKDFCDVDAFIDLFHAK